MTWDELMARAEHLATQPDRAVLGVVGPPGAGKSRLADAMVAALGERAVLLPMDGFHLANEELDRLGRLDRKGAPDTFDAAGYAALLRRVRAREEEVVYAPVFRRDRELAEAGVLPIPSEVPLVITEGNYLLADGPFRPVRQLLSECWYLEVDAPLRRERLVVRHMRHGRTAEQAQKWVATTDEPNARLVETTRVRADLVVRLP